MIWLELPAVVHSARIKGVSLIPFELVDFLGKNEKDRRLAVFLVSTTSISIVAGMGEILRQVFSESKAAPKRKACD